MSGFSTSLADATINATLRNAGAQVFPVYRNKYFALFTSDPTDAFSSGTEVSASWYVRQPTGAFAAPTNGVTYNATQVVFPAVTGSSVTVTHIGIVEGASATDGTSTLLYSHQLTTPKTLTVSDIYVIGSDTSSGDFTLSLL